MNLPVYVVITPAWNEADFIERTIQSMLAQTFRPAKWVIVSDGSTDGTDEIVSRYLADNSWIELVRMPERRERHFAGKANAFNAGRARVADLPYEVIGNLDADASFDAGYFALLMSKFAENPQLGLAGTPYREFECQESERTYDYRFTSIEHVSGICQMFRRECFDAIGGYQPVPSGGIDLIAVLSARAKGWQTRTFTETYCIHHRKMGAAHHIGFRERMHRGHMDYLLGSHPAWEIFRSIYQMKNKPRIIGGFLMMAGYVWPMLRRVERTMPRDLMQLRRRDQMTRLRSVLGRALGIMSLV